jgi:hypothetical protein
MSDNSKDLLNFWEDQMKQSHTSSNYFFRKSPSHYHMMLLEKTSTDQRIKNIMPSESFINEFKEYLNTLKKISY